MRKTNAKKLTAILAMAAVISLTGCKNDNESYIGDSDIIESLPIDASNNNMGGASSVENSSSEEVTSSESEPEVVVPYVHEDPYMPPAEDIITTTPEQGGTFDIWGNGHLMVNLVPKYGARVKDGIKLNEVSINGEVYDITEGLTKKDFIERFNIVDQNTSGGSEKRSKEIWSANLNDYLVLPEDMGSGEGKEYPVEDIDFYYYTDNSNDRNCYFTKKAYGFFVETVSDDGNVDSRADEDTVKAITDIVPFEYVNGDYAGVDSPADADELYEMLHSAIAEDEQVIFAGGVQVGQTKEKIDAYLGKGCEYEFKIDDNYEREDDRFKDDDYLISIYKTDEATLAVGYRLDEGQKANSVFGIPEVPTTYTKNNGYYAEYITLFKNN